MKIIHQIPPIYDQNSKILILGTMPSPKSRENQIYYGHPQNRFWTIMAEILNSPFPENNTDKINLLKSFFPPIYHLPMA